MSIIDIIPFGAENAINRAELAEKSGMTDRRMRLAIQRERDNGELILNDQRGNGYYRATADDLDAIYRQYKQDTARAMAILKRRKAMREILKAAGRAV